MTSECMGIGEKPDFHGRGTASSRIATIAEHRGVRLDGQPPLESREESKRIVK